MRHGSLLAGAVALLAAGVVAGAGGRLLVAAAGGPAGLTPADGGAGRRAVPLAPVAACADTDLEGARLAVEDPVALFGCRQGRSWPGPGQRREEGQYSPARQLSSRALTETERANSESPFFYALRASFYSKRAPSATGLPLPRAPSAGGALSPASPRPPPAPTTAPSMTASGGNRHPYADFSRRSQGPPTGRSGRRDGGIGGRCGVSGRPPRAGPGSARAPRGSSWRASLEFVLGVLGLPGPRFALHEGARPPGSEGGTCALSPWWRPTRGPGTRARGTSGELAGNSPGNFAPTPPPTSARDVSGDLFKASCVLGLVGHPTVRFPELSIGSPNPRGTRRRCCRSGRELGRFW